MTVEPSQRFEPTNAAQQPETVFAEAVNLMARLRGPDGCPWDREQSFDSIRRYTLEETYEVLDAIDHRDWNHLEEELGDLLLQVLLYSQMAAEEGYFNITDVIAGLNRKLVRRHPHVFGEAASLAAGNAAAGIETKGIDAGQVLRNWEQIKRAEKEREAGTSGAASGTAGPSVSILDSIPSNFPALMEAAKLGSKAARSGFDWPDADGVFAKLDEELAEVREAIALRDEEGVAAEVGDLLFTVVNLARHLGVDAELSLRGTNGRFRRRFAAVERASDLPLERQPPERLESLWAAAKDAEKSGVKEGAE